MHQTHRHTVKMIILVILSVLCIIISISIYSTDSYKFIGFALFIIGFIVGSFSFKHMKNTIVVEHIE
jgi:Zn-dependent protease with chaperone function